MKSILVIGLGRLGRHLCQNFEKWGNEVLAIDKDEERVDDILPYVTGAQIGDCTKEAVLRSLGVGNFDICIVAIGNAFQASLEITSLLKELGAKYVISKADRDIQEKFLRQSGADEIIYPERQIAENIAVRLSRRNVFDFTEVSDDHGIFEIMPLKEWIGHAIRDIGVRQKYEMIIVATKTAAGEFVLPDPDYVFTGERHLLVLMKTADFMKFAVKYDKEY